MAQDLDQGQPQFPGVRYYMGDSHGWFQRASPIIDVTCFPFLADPDGTRDSTKAIQSAINLAQQIGGRLYLPGTFLISSTLVIGNGASGVASSVQGIRLIGAGPPQSAYYDSGYVSRAPTKLLWAGPSSGVMVQIAGPLQGWGVEDLQFDGGNLSTTCLQVMSAEGGDVKKCHFVNCKIGIQCVPWANAPPGFGAFNSMHNSFKEIVVIPQNINNARGISLEGNAGITADAAYNRFDNVEISFPASGTNTIYGIYMAVCDSNVFTDVHLFGGTATMAALAFDYSVNAGFPDSNTFFGIDFKASALIQQAINIGSPSGASPNAIFGLMQANGATDPGLANLNIFTNSGTNTANAFQTWSPTFSSQNGTLGTTTVNSARYTQINKQINFFLDVSITSAGTTPSGFFQFSLPVTARNVTIAGALAGVEQALTDAVLGGFILGSGGQGRVTSNLGATNITTNGNRIVITGMYEAA